MPAQQTGPERALLVVRQLLLDGRYRAALNAAIELIDRYPDAPGPLTLAARASIALGDSPGARDFAHRATQLRPRNVAARLLYAQTLVLLGDAPQAFRLVGQIEESAAQRAGALRRIARFHEQFGCEEQAYRVLLNAMEADPDHADAVYRAALLARRLGHQKTALALCRRVFSLDPDHPEACFLRATLQVAKAGEHHLAALDFLLQDHPDESTHRGALCRALGRELEDLGQFEAAFLSYKEAARLHGVETGASHQLEASKVGVLEEVYAPLRATVYSEDEGEGQSIHANLSGSADLVLVGLPCAGLDEFRRWLGAQENIRAPDVTDPLRWLLKQHARTVAKDPQPIGEGDMRAFARALERQRGGSEEQSSEWLLHEAPAHYLHFGLLRRALPRALFIHLRRDPLDQCLDLFCPGPGEPKLVLDSLDAASEHFTAYHRLMGFWRRHFPGAILEIDYEQFVADPERVWGKVSRFLSLAASEPVMVQRTFTERPEERQGRAGRFTSELSTLARRLRANGVPVS